MIGDESLAYLKDRGEVNLSIEVELVAAFWIEIEGNTSVSSCIASEKKMLNSLVDKSKEYEIT